jgi:hypothetical protein
MTASFAALTRSPGQHEQAVSGTPAVFAVFRLITSSYFVGECTGSSPPFHLLMMWSM